MTSKLSAAARFFYVNAGHSYTPSKETEEEGRVRGALNLAAAESLAREAGYSFEWSTSDIDSSDYTDETPAWPLYDCIMRDINGKVVQCLGACDFGKDADGPFGDYRRVVEAELASEEIDTVLETVRA